MKFLKTFGLAIVGLFMILGVTRMNYTDPFEDCISSGGHVVYEKGFKGRLEMRCAATFVERK